MNTKKDHFGKLLAFQKSEITEHIIYDKLARLVREEANKKIFRKISQAELEHYQIWKKRTAQDVNPDRLRIWWFVFIARLLGVTFTVKLMERGENLAQKAYQEIFSFYPEAEQIINDETIHEEELIALIEEERLKYIGSIVLGLNDALVELTGALAGFTFALQNTRLIFLLGLITGVSASFSMAASEYLSTRTEKGGNPFKSAVYTWLAYIFTVFILVLPYLVFSNYLLCLALVLFSAVLLIVFFTFYVSVALDFSFKSRFLEMTLVTLGVASFSFLIGFLVRRFFGIEV